MRDERKRGSLNDERRSKRSSSTVPRSSFDFVTPKKRLGQTFLTDERVVERIIQDVGPRADETIVEIGPGRGALTSQLVEKAGRLVTIEYDRDLVPLLREKFGARENFILIEADALSIDLCATLAPATQARIVANLPYYISSQLLLKYLNHPSPISLSLLMLQKEMARRLSASPSTKDYGALTLLVQLHYRVEFLRTIPTTVFIPRPEVDSAVVRLGLDEIFHVGRLRISTQDRIVISGARVFH